jgi:hypothetical protein
MGPELGRVADPEALAADRGPCARLGVVVPVAWSEAGGQIEVVAPKRLACARCDGGGCDGCGRSGALRAPDDERGRALRVTLPKRAPGAVVVRIAHPFGERSPIAQLLLEIRPGPEPSPNVTSLAERPRLPGKLVVALALGLLAAAILWTILAR